MIFGVGCDMVEIARIQRSLAREGFAARVFSPDELRLFSGCTRQLAGCFAAKEAFGKAMGTGIRGFALSEVSALRDSLGKPYYVFAGRALELVERRGLTASLSITNEGGFALAFAVLEERA